MVFMAIGPDPNLIRKRTARTAQPSDGTALFRVLKEETSLAANLVGLQKRAESIQLSRVYREAIP